MPRRHRTLACSCWLHRSTLDCATLWATLSPTPRTPHPHLLSQGWRYGTSSARTGDDRLRGGQTRYFAHPWSANDG